MKKNYIFFVEHAVFYKAQSLFYFNTELYAIKLSKKYFVDLCSKLTFVWANIAFSQQFLAAKNIE